MQLQFTVNGLADHIFGVAHCDDLRLLRPEAATVGCCRRQQHLWSHRNPYSRPQDAVFTCGRRPQDFLSPMSRHKSGRMFTIRILYLYYGAKRKGNPFQPRSRISQYFIYLFPSSAVKQCQLLSNLELQNLKRIPLLYFYFNILYNRTPCLI